MLAISITVAILIGAFSHLMAQSEQGVEIFNEAKSVHESATSNTDIKKARDKYEQALRFFEEVSDRWQIVNVETCLGNIFKDWGQYGAAMKRYEKALDLCRATQNTQGEASVLVNLGDVHFYGGQLSTAIDCYNKSLEIGQKNEYKEQKAAALNGLGLAYCHLGEYSKANKFLLEAEDLVSYHSNSKIWAHIVHNRGKVSYEEGSNLAAVEMYEPALELRKTIGDIRGQADTLDALALVDLTGYGLVAVAERRFKEALEIRRKLSDRREEGISLNNLGTIYQLTGEYDKALACIDKALGIATSIGNPEGEATALDNMGRLYMSRGEYIKAEKTFQKVLLIKQKLLDIKGVANTLTNLGSANLSLGRDKDALDYWDSGLQLFLQIGFPSVLPGSHVKNLQANYYLDNSDIENAKISLKLPEPHEEIFEAIKNGPVEEIPGVYGGEHFFYISQSGLLASQGRLSLTTSDYDGAIKFYETIRLHAERNWNSTDLFTANTGLGLAYENQGNFTKAIEHYEKAVEFVENVRISIPKHQRENFFDVKVDGFLRTAPYEGLARVLIMTNRCAEALKQSEYTKARIFSEVLSTGANRSTFAIPKEIIDRDRQIQDGLTELFQKLRETRGKTGMEDLEEVSAVDNQVRRTKEKLAKHIVWLRQNYPVFAASRYPIPMDLSETALKPDEWVLEYDVTDTGLAIYLIQGKNLIKGLFKPVPKKDLEELVSKVRGPLEVVPGKDQVSDKLKAFDFNADKRLSDLLLADILPDLPKGASVIIVPDDCLGTVPFEMLVINSGGEIKTDSGIPYVSGAEFFGDRNPISYYQSITALTLARTLGTNQRPQDRLLVVADPVCQMKDARVQEGGSSTKLTGVEARLYEDLMATVEDGKVGGLSFYRLPLTGPLAENLNTAFKGSCTLYTGLKANKQTFMKEVVPSLGDYSKVVFATHGYFGKGLPGINEPVLVFSLVPPGTDGYLRMSEVMGLKMNADMVALTACQSGLGKELSGEGVMGMGRAFQFAGAKSVLMSLWSVAESSSVNLVESFFRHIKEGKGKLEALKLAREEIRKQGYDHPFFWAAFILVGEVN
jgi:tetratricopeptide (TPR) repeat protein